MIPFLSLLLSSLKMMYSCGDVFPEDQNCSTCEAGEMVVRFSLDACLSPACLAKDWSDGVGKACNQATDLILTEYSGMTIECTTDTSVSLLSVEDENVDLDRVYIVTDGGDIVIQPPKVG
jgi:hypothetical protein